MTRDWGRDEGTGAGRSSGGELGAPGKRTLTEQVPMPTETRAAGSAGGEPRSTSGSGGSASALPGSFRERMEAAFGFDFSGVRIHEGSEAPAVGAVAYAHGADLHFAPGAYDPSSARGQELIGHELAHVVQQSEGRVSATRQAKGVGLNDEGHLEREADDWGARAARGETVSRSSTRTAPGDGGAVQRAPVSSHWGEFVDSGYHKLADGDGVEIDLTFKPGPEVDATKIGFSQSLLETEHGATEAHDPTEKLRMVQRGPNAGNRIDRLVSRTNPIYGSDDVGPGTLKDTKQTNAPGGRTPDKTNATYQLGHRYKQAGHEQIADAWMHDEPESERAKNSGMEFESTALAIDGAQKGTYYGSVRWGYKVDAAGNLRKIDFALVSAGAPSPHFLAAAASWNAATVQGTVVVSADNALLYDRFLTPRFTLAKGTEVYVSSTGVLGGVSYSKLTIQTGPHALQTGFIKVTDLTDKGDGEATTDLPIPDVHVLVEACELNRTVDGPLRESRVLPAGTRVIKTGERWGHPPPTQVWIKVVDGPNTGAEGYAESGKLSKERL